MAKGNPNPSPATRFKKGQSGNPSGRSSQELKDMNEAAKIAAKLTLKALSSLQDRLDEGEKLSTDDLAFLFSADARGMIKEAQDRAHGTARQSVDVESPNGTMTPQPVDAALAAGLAKKLTE